MCVRQTNTPAGTSHDRPVNENQVEPPGMSGHAIVGRVLKVPLDEKVTDSAQELPLTEHVPLRPLTSLKWPYVPDESAFPDPLKRDDPKMLQLPQYEAIGEYSSLFCSLN